MLEIFGGDPDAHREFARGYYEVDLPSNAVEHIYNHKALTDDAVRSLNPSELTAAAVEAEAIPIGGLIAFAVEGRCSPALRR